MTVLLATCRDKMSMEKNIIPMKATAQDIIADVLYCVAEIVCKFSALICDCFK